MAGPLGQLLRAGVVADEAVLLLAQQGGQAVAIGHRRHGANVVGALDGGDSVIG